jgi:diaminopimelate decarboxylase
VVDVVIDAVLPGPGALGHAGLLERLVAGGHARIPAGRRGLDVAENGNCRGSDGRSTPGLSAIGRPTEDSVIGNDTLSRSLHAHADRWARRVARRCQDDSIAAARRGLRWRAPA